MKNSKKLSLRILLLAGSLLLLVIFLLSGSGRLFIHDISTTDTQLFFDINRHHAHFWDVVMYIASDKIAWLPFYALLVYFLFKAFGKKCWQALLMILLLIIASDQIASDLIKNTVKRLRPSHETALLPYIHLSKAGPGGLYGFVSSHAANATALAVFMILLLPKDFRPLKYVLAGWALLVSYSRIYNGVHYPSDVFVAIIIGSLLGMLFYFIYQFIFFKSIKDAA